MGRGGLQVKEGFNRWGRPARVVLSLSLLSLAGSALAAAPNLPLTPDPLPDRVVRHVGRMPSNILLDALGPSKPAQMMMRTTANLPTTLAKAGKFVKWGGVYVLAPSLVNGALHWLYDQAQQAGNPIGVNPLFDSWYKSKPQPQNGGGTYPSIGSYNYDSTLPNCYGKSLVDNQYAKVGEYISYYVARHKDGSAYYTMGAYNSTTAQQTSPGSNINPPFTNVTELCKKLAPAQVLEPPTLEEWSKKLSPTDYEKVGRDLAEGLGKYITANPDSIRPSLDPLATPNQWTDNPYTDPAGDLDKDGVPDYVEVERGTDPDDPMSKPDDRDVVSKTTVTTRNPDGSTTTTTTTKYSDGTQEVVKVTVRKETIKNPDGSTTTRTTTTTETTDRDGKTTTKTRTEEKTDPAPEPAPEPPKEEGPCVAAGGTWGGEPPACTMPEKEPDPEVPTFDKPDPFKPPNFDLLKTKWNDQLKNLSEATKDKFPFGLVNPVQSLSMSGVDGEGSPCPPLRFDVVSLPEAKIGMNVDACGTVGAKYTHDYLRPLVSWLLIGLTVFACARVAGQA